MYFPPGALFAVLCPANHCFQNNMNNRANIMYFIEQLCTLAARERPAADVYVHNIQRDILRIVDAVVPPDGSGAANAKHVRRVLGGLRVRAVLGPDSLAELDAALRDREASAAADLDLDLGIDMEPDPGVTVPTAGNGDWGGSSGMRSGPSRPVSSLKLDRRQIEQRIEEDRERNKRLRENMWAVPGTDRGEFDKMWDELSDIGEDDYQAAYEEAAERRRIAEEYDYE